ncbi:MAG: hypothetical protein HLUCCO02_01140 [Idiomarinaceae bacterium HL-53]|nr:MAG: hypothetical protein HLUCCO02_01140 [Idiomarinaceae bacterium HL-53]
MPLYNLKSKAEIMTQTTQKHSKGWWHSQQAGVVVLRAK